MGLCGARGGWRDRRVGPLENVRTGKGGKGRGVAGQRQRALHESAKESEDAGDRGLAQACEGLQSRSGDGQEGAEHVDAALPLRTLGGGDDEIARVRGSGGEEAGEGGVDPRLQHLEQLRLDARDFRAAPGERREGAEARLPHVRVPRVLPVGGEEGEEGDAVGGAEHGWGRALEKGGEDVVACRAEGGGRIGGAEGGQDRRQGEELDC